MNEHDAIYRAILDAPNDDTPRLVYADWLEENGRAEEAEFLRLDCRLETYGPELPDAVELGERREELRLWLSAHVPPPDLKFKKGITAGWGGWWHFTGRGFPRFLNVRKYGRWRSAGVKRIVAGLEHAFAHVPVRWVVFDEFNHVDDLTELLKQPALAALNGLTINAAPGADEDAAAVLVAASPCLANLNRLYLPYALGESGAHALAQSPHLARLIDFSIHADNLTPAAIRAFSRGEWFHQLHELNLDGSMTDEAFEEFTRLRPFSQLHTLRLENKYFTAATWRSLARSRSFPALRRLELRRSDLSLGQMRAFANGDALSLTELDLTQCSIQNGGVAALLDAPWTETLTRLDLSYNRLNSKALPIIAQSRELRSLKYLNLSGNRHSGSALKSLAKSPIVGGLVTLLLGDITHGGRVPAIKVFGEFLKLAEVSRLRRLELAGFSGSIDVTNAEVLAGDKFRSLRRLGLANCNLSDDATTTLMTAPALQDLIELDLRSNAITSASVTPLLDRSVLPQLSACNLQGTSVDAGFLRKLKRRQVIVE